MLGLLRKLLARPQAEARAPDPADVDIGPEGIHKTYKDASDGFAWDEIVSIELAWSENPWGDPFAGPYCDTEWIIKRATSPHMWVYDSEENRAVLLPAFARYLPGFVFDYAAFDRAFRHRTGDLDGGAHPVWSRSS